MLDLEGLFGIDGCLPDSPDKLPVADSEERGGRKNTERVDERCLRTALETERVGSLSHRKDRRKGLRRRDACPRGPSIRAT